MQAHFENIQRISDTITLPHAMHNLSCRIAEELDLSHLLERLIQGKGQPNTLTQSEKLELWGRLKILRQGGKRDFELGSVVKIDTFATQLIETMHGSNLKESGDMVDREDQQKFLGSVDFLSQHGIPALISDMETATKEVLKGKQLSGLFNSTTLHETIMQILNTFMSMGSPHSWVKYMMPENDKSHSTTSGDEDTVPSDMAEFEQLMMEARAVLSSAEFGGIVEISLKAVVDTLVDLMGAKFRGSATTGLPLARVLPQVAQMCPLLLEEPSKNQFIQVIKNLQEVELFFTLLYANMPRA
ncbi:Peroxin-3 [Sesbania bispinosa]|nr:Peroxin-3 [Sesbania bispinosa]